MFAESGYRGASVRDICDQARANPGAVSYHFGGKRQLYRAVLRRAASELAEMQTVDRQNENEEATPVDAAEALRRISSRLVDDDTATRLLLRDLADGGSVAVESLTPLLRSAFEQLAISIGEGDNPRASARARVLFLELAAPIFLLTAAWPVVSRALDLEPDRREELMHEMLDMVFDARGHNI
jgi:AcrR family transcriptional regulator